ncbi:MAG: tRNA (adenosine(37)-N6)-dimethylallyltransferase MiaA [Flavobacteriales bacterium]|nr:tRNA (adenosine(37)-N6)-dimethylallyltransferase MiaA [Flavobacteriales bacterium]
MSANGLLVVIGGPTASGKTKVAASMAKHFGTEVISGDSRQFYRAMRIGTARPSEEELLGVKHHFLGHLELNQTWSAGEFARQAEPVLQELLGDHGIAVLVGGSGLYLDAFCNGLDPMPMADHAVREKLQHRFQQHGLPDLLAELDRLDPTISTVIDRNNPQRVIRALEVCIVSGKPFSAQHKGHRQRTDIRVLRIAMDVPRTELYANIDARVDQMIADGLEEEVRSLLPHRELNALRTVGYREFFEHFDGKLSREEAIELIKQHTRNYAKRQMTWLRREKAWKWTKPDDLERIKQFIDEAL